MKGRLIDFSFGCNRKQRVTVELDSDFREGFDALKEADVEVSIKKWRAKRSKDANAYFHVLVNQIAMARGLSDDGPSPYRTAIRSDSSSRPASMLRRSIRTPECINRSRKTEC